MKLLAPVQATGGGGAADANGLAAGAAGSVGTSSCDVIGAFCIFVDQPVFVTAMAGARYLYLSRCSLSRAVACGIIHICCDADITPVGMDV